MFINIIHEQFMSIRGHLCSAAGTFIRSTIFRCNAYVRVHQNICEKICSHSIRRIKPPFSICSLWGGICMVERKSLPVAWAWATPVPELRSPTRSLSGSLPSSTCYPQVVPTYGYWEETLSASFQPYSCRPTAIERRRFRRLFSRTHADLWLLRGDAFSVFSTATCRLSVRPVWLRGASS